MAIYKNNQVCIILLILWCAMSIISFSDTSEAVDQKTSGDKSPNINAPSAKSVTVNYGISETMLRKLLKGQEGKGKVIESLVEELRIKNIKIDQQDAIILNWIKMYQELEKRSNETMQTKNKIEPLIKFTHKEFIDNFVTFKAYYQYRKTLQLLNPDMLIELLKVYFRSVLLYPSNNMNKYYITASDGRLLLLQIEGHNEKGERVSISLPDISESILKDVCMDFIKSANPKHYEMIETLFDCALATPELDKVHKINILEAKSFILKHKLLLNTANNHL